MGFSRRALFAAAAILTLGAAPASADQAAETFVAGILDEANVIFAETDTAARDAQVETLVDKYVDMDRVAKFALGRYVRQASDAQLAEYLPLFRRYATSVYQATLEGYTGQKLAVTDSIDRSERDIIVNSKVVDAKPGDRFADLEVHWRIYSKPDGAQAVVDAGAEGVWLAIEQRSQFESVIANNGGGAAGINALIGDLRAKVGG